MSLAGKIALVTGAARNTGWGIARSLAEKGVTICLHDIHAEDVEVRVNELRQAHPDSDHIALVADLRDDAQIADNFATIERRFGRLDILVCNAVHQGLGGGPFPETPIALFDDVWAINVRGHILCAQHAARIMPDDSSIVIIGSNTSMRAIRDRAAYITSKGALSALTRALALDLAPRRIRVNEVAPGYIYTERWDNLDPALAARRRANLPLGREVESDEIGELVAYLSSDAASSMTGTSIPIAAGIDTQLVPSDCEA